MQLFNNPAPVGDAAMTKPEIGAVNVGLSSMQSFALSALGRNEDAADVVTLVLKDSEGSPDLLTLG